MHTFDYSSLARRSWDVEILSYLSKIGEFKGRQELFYRQKPVELERLIEIAKIQSTEASNAIEGIVSTKSRIAGIVREKTVPKNRDEKEIAGYRDVLNLIHEQHEAIPLTPNYILQLHRNLLQYTGKGYGGKFKTSQNEIVEKLTDGTTKVLFVPAAPFQTELFLLEACDSFRKTREEGEIEPLILIPAFILDFLCIHPFFDGNGRMSRLLTILLLDQSGYEIGKYTSIEKFIAQSKDTYYAALQESDEGWHEGKNNPTPFIKYMLGVLIACYREFEERRQIIGGEPDKKSKAIDIVKRAVETRIGRFSKTDIFAICPTLSASSVEKSLKQLVGEGQIEAKGLGKRTYYVRKSI